MVAERVRAARVVSDGMLAEVQLLQGRGGAVKARVAALGVQHGG
jgi:hypothetical protein